MGRFRPVYEANCEAIIEGVHDRESTQKPLHCAILVLD